MGLTILEAKNIGHCVVLWNDSGKHWDITKWGIRSSKTNSNKMIVFDLDSYWFNPWNTLSYTGIRARADVGKKVFVDPSCHIRRDLVRRNFKITRDKDSADYILFPDTPPDPKYGTSQVVVYGPDETFVSVEIKSPIINDEMWNMLLMTLTANYGSGSLLYTNRNSPFTYWFLPYYEIYIDILTEKDCDKRRKYLNEYKIPYGEVKLTPEALMMWRNIKNSSMLASEIKQTDWRNYPFTLSCFLIIEADKYNVMHHTMNEIRYSLPVNFTDAYNRRGNYSFADFDNKYIAPEDWNLMQEYLLMRLGVSKDGGFVSIPPDFPYEYRQLLRQRLAVAPLYLKEGAVGHNLITDVSL